MYGSFIQEKPNLTPFLLEIWIIYPEETQPYFIPPRDMDNLSRGNPTLLHSSS